MADYYPLIARAISGLDPSAPGESRRALYERARAALIAQGRPPSDSLLQNSLPQPSASPPWTSPPSTSLPSPPPRPRPPSTLQPRNERPPLGPEQERPDPRQQRN